MLNSTGCPLTFNLGGICSGLSLFFVNITTSVLEELNLRPAVWPQVSSLVTTFYSLFIMYFKFVPVNIVTQSSANPFPKAPYEFIILIASLKAIIQNLALHTPP